MIEQRCKCSAVTGERPMEQWPDTFTCGSRGRHSCASTASWEEPQCKLNLGSGQGCVQDVVKLMEDASNRHFLHDQERGGQAISITDPSQALACLAGTKEPKASSVTDRPCNSQSNDTPELNPKASSPGTRITTSF